MLIWSSAHTWAKYQVNWSIVSLSLASCPRSLRCTTSVASRLQLRPSTTLSRLSHLTQLQLRPSTTLSRLSQLMYVNSWCLSILLFPILLKHTLYCSVTSEARRNNCENYSRVSHGALELYRRRYLPSRLTLNTAPSPTATTMFQHS